MKNLGKGQSFEEKKLRKTCDNPLAKLRLQQYQQTDPSLRFAELTKLIKC